MNPTPTTPSSPDPEIPFGTLAPGEKHPAVVSALQYLHELPVDRMIMLHDFFANAGAEGGKFAAVCGETLRRLIHREVVGDRYAIAVAWVILTMIPDPS